ncbi:MAG: UvrD-helicase domain-containing protein [Bacteroidales bacterium]|jgi:ATP-dependent helicase/nuclease subunit A
MGQGVLTRFSASAGSGKTFRLAEIYLTHLFRSGDSYRRILAVTFTNKATGEMKRRILDQLHILSTGGVSKYLDRLLEVTGKTEPMIRKEAGEILYNILHDFSRFSVCTIDSFFQKIIRAFARESGLQSGFNIEVDHTALLSSAVDEMIASSVSNSDVQGWLNDYVISRLDEDKAWNPREDIMKLSEELFREKFRILSASERSKLEDKSFLQQYIGLVGNIVSVFDAELTSLGNKCLKIFNEYSLTDDMFYYKSRGVPGFIRSLSQGRITEPNKYVREIMNAPPKWSSKELTPQLHDAIMGGLEQNVRKAILFYDREIVNYNSAREILRNIYALGILTDVLLHLRHLTTSENTFLLSDAGEFLSMIIGGDQTPFIYEKIGNRYENYMIDEFQDTSIMQWNNFFPLISESLGSGNDNLVVGDVKQSIYRFRNSDWRILGKILDNQLPEERLRSLSLNTNFRSRSNIVKFNNSIFTIIPRQIDELFSDDPEAFKFSEIYSEAVQNFNRSAGNTGFVKINFIEDAYEDDSPVSDGSSRTNKRKVARKWEELVLEKLPLVIEEFQDKGYSASDIGILVRDSREGTDVLNTMIRYSNSCSLEKKMKYNYNIVSNYSLVLSNSPAIIFIISVLRVLSDSEDIISRAQMLRFFLIARGENNADDEPLFRDSLINGSQSCLPEGTDSFLERNRNLPLFDVVENIIGFFGLGEYPWNVVYLNAFQDKVLNFTTIGQSIDIDSFIAWWDIEGAQKSVVLPENQNAVTVLTIHKSKGLEFSVVVLPFISWNLDHNTYHQPVIWVKPDKAPFNKLGILPVRYKRSLGDTIFESAYRQEKYSAYLDNLNLLYVAMTRAKDAIYGFIPDKPDANSGIAEMLKKALLSEGNLSGDNGIVLSEKYDVEKKCFEFGEIPVRQKSFDGRKSVLLKDYQVNRCNESLKLKLHSENYFSSDSPDIRNKISYGKLMHEVFEGIDTAADIPRVVRKMVLEGKIPESDSVSLTMRLNSLIAEQPASEWFEPGNIVMKETEILLPSGNTRRPDRVILKDGKVIIVDFKFGQESPHHINQMKQYRKLLSDMGYDETEACLWYVDSNIFIRV